MHEADFRKLLLDSAEELAIKTDAHRSMWQFGQEERWEVDQSNWTLKFFFRDKLVSAPVQIIGTFNRKDHTWLWAWANSTLEDPVIEHSIKLQELGQQWSMKKLTTPKWSCKERDGWEMLALAVKMCGTQCGYRGPVNDLLFFMSFGDINISQIRG